MSLDFLTPDTAQDLPIFYLFWMLLYLAINIVWDIRSPRTPDFHLAHFALKTSVLFNSASFASSLLLMVGVFHPPTMKVAGDTFIPILLAAIAGLFMALSELCPYKPQLGQGRPPQQ